MPSSYQVARTLIAWDAVLGTLTFLAGLVGALFSVYTLTYTWARYRHLRMLRIAGRRSGVVLLHLVLHSGIFVSQVILVAVSGVMFTLPPTPDAMYLASADGTWIATVIAGRKLARVVTSLVQLAMSVYMVRWLRRA